MASAAGTLYPLVEAHDRGMLAVGDGNAVYWEVAGRDDGKPAVVLHGGPGQGSAPNMRRGFDPARYRTILFDQRGCGRSTPHASEPATPMRFNTTHHLIADMEALRAHLGVDRWLVFGGSWGAALALAYAERYPSRVSALVLASVTTARRSEAAWLYGELARLFPEAAERFRGHVPEAREGDVIAAYAARMEHPEPSVRLAAARAWCAWEESVLALEPVPVPGLFAGQSARDMLAFVRICTHYLRHAAWLDEDALIRDAGRLAGIPGVLIHGRRDVTCPVDTAWALARAWPGARLTILDDAGHLGSDSNRTALLAALDAFARG
ncbi:MAG TPA: prolyl aminopeptidase [Polyangia bacterium]|nr:prolyl aminopeptidase [Polyangia bacterium]